MFNIHFDPSKSSDTAFGSTDFPDARAAGTGKFKNPVSGGTSDIHAFPLKRNCKAADCVAVRHIQPSVAREPSVVEFVTSPMDTTDTTGFGVVSPAKSAGSKVVSIVGRSANSTRVYDEGLFSEAFVAKIEALCDEYMVKDMPRAEGGTTGPVYLPESFPQIVLKERNEKSVQSILEEKQQIREALNQLQCSHLIVPEAIGCKRFLVEDRLPININIYHNFRLYLSETKLFDEPVREMVRLSSKFWITDILIYNPYRLKFRYIDGVSCYPKYENLPLYIIEENGLKQGRIGLVDVKCFFQRYNDGDSIPDETIPDLARVFPLHEHIIREEADLLGIPYDENELSTAFAQANKCLKFGYSDHADWLKLKGVTSEYRNWSFDISQKSLDDLNTVLKQELLLMNQGEKVVFERNIMQNPRGRFLTGDVTSAAKTLSSIITPIIISNLKSAMAEYVTQNTTGKAINELTEDQIIFLRSPAGKMSRYYKGVEEFLTSSPYFCGSTNDWNDLPCIAEQLVHSAFSHLVTCKELLYYTQSWYGGKEATLDPPSKFCWLGY